MSRTRRFVGGISAAYAYQAVVVIAGLWLTPLFLSRLGAHDYGLWLTAAQALSYLTLLDFGVVALLPREVAFATGRANGAHASDLPEIVARTAGIVLLFMPLVAGAALAAWWAVPGEWQSLEAPLALLLACFVITYPFRIFQAVLQGLQDLTFVGAVQLVAWISGTALSVALVLAGWKLAALAAGLATTQLVTSMACACRLLIAHPGAAPRALPDLSRHEVMRQLGAGLWVTITQVAQVLLYATDMLIVAAFFGPVTVVPYACTQKLISVLANQPQILTQAAAPALSELRMGASKDKLLSVTSSLSLALLLGSGAVLSVVVAVNRSFVSWWVGPDQFGGLVLTGLFAGAMLARHWATSLVYSLFAFGRERRIALTTLADGLVTLTLSLVLTPWIGVSGVPLAFLCGALFVSVPANLRALAREVGEPPVSLVAPLVPLGVRLAAVVVIAAGVNLFVRSGSFIAVAVTAAAMAAVYAALMLPVALRPPLGDYLQRALAPVLAFVRPRSELEVVKDHARS